MISAVQENLVNSVECPSVLKKSNQSEWVLDQPLAVADPEVAELIKKECTRQFRGLELIASENYISLAVMQATGSILTNKYAEGLPGARYYGGNQVIDAVERLCQKRALATFGLSEEEWGVNVQPYSGSTANFAVYTAVLQPHERVMGLDLPSGGHLTHGYATAKRKVSSTSIYFESMPYQVDQKSGLIDYERLEQNAKLFHPKLLICGGSAYPREWDYARFKKIADSEGAWLLCDMAHISGLVAAATVSSPFEWADIVSTTTHKTLRGPRAGLIFFRKGKRAEDGKVAPNGDLETRINNAVFPACQGGPHENTIAGVAVALKQAATPEFREYALQILRNCQAMATGLMARGYKVCTDGTDNHLLLWDLRPEKLPGARLEKICELVEISVNKNSIAGDVSAMNPGGVRLGTAALTTRGFVEADIKQVVGFLHQCVLLAKEVHGQCQDKKSITEFISLCNQDSRIKEVRDKVEEFASKFPMPGYDFTMINY